MQRTQKEQLRTVVTTLRRTLQGYWGVDGKFVPGDLDRELSRLGFRDDATITALDALPNPAAHDVRAYRAAEARLAPLPTAERAAARAEIVERAAYSWINRLLALRALEARGLIAETLRANPDYEGIPEALYVLRYDAPGRAAAADGGWWAVLDDACAKQAQQLPGLFDAQDPHAALRPTIPALLTCLQTVGNPALDAAFADPDAIGWAYQFYQQEAKQRAYDKLGKGGKLETRSEIAAATQLFTEPYMVKWLLHNSLGRAYAEAYPESALPATWEYYIDRAKVLEQEADAEQPATFFTLDELTVMDPCMGSGHFLREAFDLLFAMYRERHPQMAPAEIAATILRRHLHGIDIDPRAAQLAALTLVLRAWELTKSSTQPTTLTLNLAATPTLAPGSLDRHLKRHPEDAPFRPVLEAVFGVLEQAPILGSLIQPQAQLEAALEQVRKASKGGQMGLLGGNTEANRLIEELARTNPNELKRQLLGRIERGFAREAMESDAGAQLLGREAGEGLHLLQLLERTYAVVATNPPYMGSKNMDAPLRQYVERHYKAGKRDLYAAFILRCLELTRHGGRVAMITQQSWMFLKSFADLRALPQEKLAAAQGRHEFTGLLRETAVEALAHLGPHAFEEVSGEVVQSAMFTLGKRAPGAGHRMVAYRLSAYTTMGDKALLLRQRVSNYLVVQKRLLVIQFTPIVFWVGGHLLDLLSLPTSLADFAPVKMGLSTSENPRFLRGMWETCDSDTWFSFSKGGGYAKWAGLESLAVNWQHDGARMKTFVMEVYKGNHWSKNIRNPETYMLPGATYSMVTRGSLGVRRLLPGIYEAGSNSFFGSFRIPGMAILNCRLSSFLLRNIFQGLNFPPGYTSMVPIPTEVTQNLQYLSSLGDICIVLKSTIVSADLCECTYEPRHATNDPAVCAVLHTVEAQLERTVMRMYGVEGADEKIVILDTGTPAGWHPLLTAYDALPPLPTDLNLPPLPQEVVDSLAQHQRLQPTPSELKRIKSNLRALYEAGPGGTVEDDGDESAAGDDDEETVVAGAYIPIPTETFLEELSVKLEIHPISVYWLLEELRAEGARCKPEEKRLLEDRLTVIVLRLLGHRWPRQIEAGEPVPDWADGDGIIPLTVGTHDKVLAERVRERLRAEGGDLAAQADEALLTELTGRTLEEWLRRDFFKRHVSQFKRRPVAWHLASSPVAGGRRRGAEPAFECYVYYHRTDGDLLARLRTHYVERLLERERAALASARQAKDETSAAHAQNLIDELEDFARRLSEVEESGFACAELDALIEKEALDRWSGDGIHAPQDRAALLTQERAWHVDINDGVRVNIAPLQTAGLLAQDVLANKDLRKAIADRARWRSDERRWVRAGKLPRCGWMDDSIPESPQWTALAPEREKERLRLEEKRAKALAGLEKGHEIEMESAA